MAEATFAAACTGRGQGVPMDTMGCIWSLGPALSISRKGMDSRSWGKDQALLQGARDTWSCPHTCGISKPASAPGLLFATYLISFAIFLQVRR